MTALSALSVPTRPILRYYGGKWRLAPWIISHFGRHTCYVEPCAGAASVLMRKPRCPVEIVNDLDHEVINLFRILRDLAQARELARLLFLTPFAREEFEDAYLSTDDPIEMARRFVVRSFLGHSSVGATRNRPTGFRQDGKTRGTPPPSDWCNYPASLTAVVERLRGVVIEHLPATELMPRYDSPATLFFVDPPYVLSARRYSDANYRHEMTDEDHRALVDVLRSLQGMVVVSGYPSALYDEELLPDWERITHQARSDRGSDRVEVVWLNRAAVNAMPIGRLSL